MYVLPLSGMGARVAVTGRGGTSPEWSADGRQLFFRRHSALMAVDVDTTAAEFQFSGERKVFDWEVAREYAVNLGTSGDSICAMRRIWPAVRRVWITLGITATVIFVGWSLWAYRATAEARVACVSSAEVVVVRNDTSWYFAPRSPRGEVGLVFFPGALVDSVAYAPLLRQVAGAGYPALLVEVPRRGAFGGADGPEVLDRAREAMRGVPDVRRWVVAGHSRGGVVAARAVHSRLPGIAGLVLIGTSHPRDFSLAHVTIPVTRIHGTRDTVADVEKLEANRHNLPASIRDVRIDGGNHSQFGSYGFQPGDWPATISRTEQQRLTVQGVLATLDQLVDGGIPPPGGLD